MLKILLYRFDVDNNNIYIIIYTIHTKLYYNNCLILTLLSLLNEDHRFLTFFVLEARLADAIGFLGVVGPFVKLFDFPLSFAMLSSLPLLPVWDSVSLFTSANYSINEPILK